MVRDIERWVIFTDNTDYNDFVERQLFYAGIRIILRFERRDRLLLQRACAF